MDDFDKLLARVNRAQNLFALGFFYGGIYESADNPEVYIRLKEGHFDGLNRVIDVFFTNHRLAGHKPESVGNFFGQLVKHNQYCTFLFKYGQIAHGV